MHSSLHNHFSNGCQIPSYYGHLQPGAHLDWILSSSAPGSWAHLYSFSHLRGKESSLGLGWDSNWLCRTLKRDPGRASSSLQSFYYISTQWMAAHQGIGAKHIISHHQQIKANFRGVAFGEANEQLYELSKGRIGYFPTDLRITPLTQQKLCLFYKIMHWSALESLGHEWRVK